MSGGKGTLIRWLAFGLLFCLVGCAPVVRSEQASLSQTISLAQQQTIGQTFTANYAGLSGVEVYLVAQDSAGAELRLVLCDSPVTRREIAAVVLPLEQVGQPGFYRFHFPALSASNRADYYFYLELQGAAQVELASAPGEIYPDGALYADHHPLDAQLAFRLAYDPLPMTLGLFGEAAGGLGLLLAFAFLFILPGGALLLALWPVFPRLNWFEKLSLAAGCGLAITPVLFLWTHLLGLQLGPAYAWGPPLAALVYLALRGWQTRGQWWPQRRAVLRWSTLRLPDWQDLAGILVLALVILVRLWVVRTLDAPMFGDSLHHTMIAQLLVDHNGLFDSWQPYAELTTFTYHFGLHAVIAVMHWFTGLPVLSATLWTAQILNVLAVLTPALIAFLITRSRLAGAVTLLVAGLLTSMPMFYTNWGRFTQLIGQALLPVACYLAWKYYETTPGMRSKGLLVMNWLVWSALGFAHYRVLAFGALFLIANGLLLLRSARRLVWKTVLIGAGAGVIFLPWFIRLFGGKIMALLGAELSTPASAVSQATQDYNVMPSIFNYGSPLLWLLFALVLGYGLWQRSRVMAVCAAWWGLLLLAANPRWLNLPGEGALNNFSVFIAIYLLLGSIIGGGVGLWLECSASQFTDRLQLMRGPLRSLWAPLARGLVVACLAALALWGAVSREKDVNIPEFTMVTRSDMRAAAWMQNNLPSGALILINAFPAFGGDVVAGADAGWWLPLLGPFKITVPPMTSGFDQGPDPDFSRRTVALVTTIQSKGITSQEVVDLLRDQGVGYLYIGQQYHPADTAQVLFRPDDLLLSPDFRLIYQQDRVRVFEIVEP